ncbi:metal ABC transporter substrate-binding protein [Massilia yuzhufengensis]|uniref:Zinc/manganese transport system substrate-binding protein n=1 Tax=Massilia yuzhufengensis TaxID=1164594 RepID=A0A1I1MGR2_9BURK|nr:zinc ABC transporter substrate-binding protein [Massilia yuzhufengensis]SFC80760.1 zinc/manganese transport system substrate-binding protein [Massilia yuzhufengensis]
MHRTHRTLLAGLVAAASLLASAGVHAGVNVLACEPEWQALVQELGGDKVSATSATNALQDPHRVEARPGLIARTRNADLLVCTGLDLEAGWLPLLVQQSGNARIERGRPGYFEAGSFVPRLDVPARLDRAEGDVHAFGNPHVHLNPHNIALVSTALAKRLGEIDPANAAFYGARQLDFSARWNAAMRKWEQAAAPLRGATVVEHHKNMAYLLNWLGMSSVGTLEAKPGVEPSAAHLGGLLAQLQGKPAKLVIRAAYQDPRASSWLSERARIPAVVIPYTVGADAQSGNLFALFDTTVARLTAAVK